MAIWNPYTIDTSLSDPYYSGRTEPSMREELNNMFDGKWPEIAKARPVALRKMRRDNNGDLTPCPCKSPLTGEPDIDTFCTFCFGEGYFWDEILVDTYKVILEGDSSLATRVVPTVPSLLNIPLVIFYIRSRVDITEKDRIVEIALDNEGSPVLPYRRTILYRIESLIDFRADEGRLEFWKVAAHKQKTKFLNGSVG